METSITQKSSHRIIVIRERMFAVVELAPSERRRIRSSRKTISRGNYATLNDLKQDVARRHRTARKKVS